MSYHGPERRTAPRRVPNSSYVEVTQGLTQGLSVIIPSRKTYLHLDCGVMREVEFTSVVDHVVHGMKGEQ